jgi:hypothetical protein
VDGVMPAVRVIARLLTACAVLVGLLLMHGVGVAAGAGCPGGSLAMTTSMAAPAVAGAHDTAMTEAAASTSGSALLATSPHAGGHGTLCVSTAPRGELAGPLALPAAGLAMPAVLRQLTPGGVRASGALPRAGPALLASLCVSRT